MAASISKRSWLSPLNRRRWEIFRSNRRGLWSLWIFSILFVLSLFAEFIANDRPIIASYKGETLYPIFKDYPEEKFGGFLAKTNFRDPVNQDEIMANGWMVWPPIRYSYNTTNNELPSPAPSRPAYQLSAGDACAKYPLKAEDPNCNSGNMNWLGTDDQGRDLVARLIYGFRISAGPIFYSSALSKSGRRSRRSISSSSSPRS
jgi:microcin C transport system permease protein